MHKAHRRDLDGADLALGKSLIDALPAGPEVLTYITGEQPNARRAESMGMPPRGDALDTSAMLAAAAEGNLAVLSILGANPALHYPDGRFVREAIANVPFVVVSDLFMTETAQWPRWSSRERTVRKTGHDYELAGDVLPVNAAMSLETPAGALSDLEMLVGLAEKLRRRAALDRRTRREGDRKKCRRSPKISRSATECFARVALEPKNRRGTPGVRADAQFLRAEGRARTTIASPPCAACPRRRYRPLDAARPELKTGDYVDLKCEGQIMHDSLVEVREGMPAGVIALAGGLPDDPRKSLCRRPHSCKRATRRAMAVAP